MENSAVAPRATGRRIKLWLKRLIWPGFDVGSRDKSKLRHLLLTGDIHTLDVGCGNGYFTYQAATRGKSAVGITIFPEEYARCEEMRSYIGCSNLSFKKSTIEQFSQDPSRQNSFDQVLMLDVIEHIRDDAAALRQVHGLLNTDGYLFLTVPNRDFEFDKHPHVERHGTGWHVRHGYTFESLERLLEENGFEPIDRRRYGRAGSKLAIRLQHIMNPTAGLLTLPLLRLLSVALFWQKPHTLLVLARKRGN